MPDRPRPPKPPAMLRLSTRPVEGPQREDEAPLIERAQAGDRAAFDGLVRMHFAEVHRLLLRLVGNHEDAEDLAQDCFVKAYRSLRFYRGEGRFAAWLGRIALHLARDHYRKQSSKSVDLPEEVPARERAEVGERELALEVSKAVDGLPANLRAALVLRVLEGKDYVEVGEMTGMKPATVRTQVMRARKRLMRTLSPWLGRKPR